MLGTVWLNRGKRKKDGQERIDEYDERKKK